MRQVITLHIELGADSSPVRCLLQVRQEVPSPNGAVPTPTPLPFSGALSGDLAPSVYVENKKAAVKGSTAKNEPAHTAPAGPFQKPPSDKATVHQGSSTVFFVNEPAARMGDPAMTCNDPQDAPAGSVIASGTVLVGG